MHQTGFSLCPRMRCTVHITAPTNIKPEFVNGPLRGSVPKDTLRGLGIEPATSGKQDKFFTGIFPSHTGTLMTKRKTNELNIRRREILNVCIISSGVTVKCSKIITRLASITHFSFLTTCRRVAASSRVAAPKPLQAAPPAAECEYLHYSVISSH